MSRIFIECTRTVGTRLHTGIQRFVRRTLYHAANIARSQKNLTVMPAIIEGDRFIQLAALPTHPYENRHETITLTQKAAVDFQPGDHLLMIDAAWHLDAWPALRAAQRQGAQLNFVWHDLIPLHHPEFFEAHVSARFSRYLTQVIEHADRIVAVSHEVRDQMAKHIAKTAPGRLGTLELDWNHPGANLFEDDTHDIGQPVVRTALANMISAGGNSPLLLSVSTLEPRKNHAMLLDACEHAWSDGHSLRLCIVGKAGWKVESLLERLERHPEKERRLFVWHDLTDRELDYCYRHASCLVYPSVTEGFGLPIAEAGWRRLPVVLSDTPVHKEVAGPMATYFDLDDPRQLTRIIQNIASEKNVFNAAWPEPGRFDDWRQSTERLLQKMISFPSIRDAKMNQKHYG